MSEELKPSLGAGDVDVVLGDKTYTMKPNLQAALQLSRQGGGLMGMINRCGAVDCDAITLVFQTGTGLTANGMKHDGVNERLYRAGFDSLGATMIRFLRILMNGGTPPEADAPVEEESGERPQTA